MPKRVASFVLVAVVRAGIAVGQTSAQPEPVGTLEASTDPGTCVEGTQLRLWELHTAPSGAMGRMGREPIKSVDCRWTIAGLTPGMYQGFNTVDWAVTGGGSLTVRVSGVRSGSPATVRIESRRASHNGDLAPGGEPVLTKEGLEFEHYDVSATQGDTLVSVIKTVQLEASHPAAAVDVELVENRSSLILTDPDGRPVQNARVRAVLPARLLIRGNWPVQSTEPGVYPLDGLRPGMYLLIRADGLVATCRTVPLNSTVYATLEAGRRVEVQWPRDLTAAVVRELASLSDVPGSDCPVRLAEFAPNVREPIGPGQPPAFEFAHFPSTSRLGLLRVGVPPRRILVPERGDVVVERD